MKTIAFAIVGFLLGVLVAITPLRRSGTVPGPHQAAGPAVNIKLERQTAGVVIPNEARSTWDTIDDPDIARFVGNCRDFGMPDDLIRPLVLKRLNYSGSASASPAEWWKNRHPLAELSHSASPGESAREVNQWLVSLGLDPLPDGSLAPTESFLPVEVAERLREALQALRQRLAAAAVDEMSGVSSEHASEYLAALAGIEETAKSLLTPEEFARWIMRQPDNETASRITDLPGFQYQSEAEFAAIFAIEREYDLALKDPDAAVEDLDAWRQTELERVLPPERSLQYDRSQDFSFERECRFAREQNMPDATAGQLYDLRIKLATALVELDPTDVRQSQYATDLKRQYRDDLNSLIGEQRTAKYMLGKDRPEYGYLIDR